MLKILRTPVLLLLFMFATEKIYAQTIFSDEEFLGLGIQAGITSVENKPAYLFAAGVSLNRKVDLNLSFLNAKYQVSRDRTIHTTTVLLTTTFFPTLEKEDDYFTTEFAAGLGGGGVHDVTILSFGLGISRVMIGDLYTSNIRPRFSVSYSALLGNKKPGFNQPAISAADAAASLEMILHIKSDRTSFLITPFLNLYPSQRTTASGLSSSFIF